VGEILTEPLLVHRLADHAGAIAQAGALLERVGLTRDQLGHYPHQFSGGQRQRIGIARALALRPQLIICDEPVSALDVSVQAQVLNLLKDLQREFGIAYLFISHDLAVVAHLCPRVAVMYLGEIVELGPAERIYQHALHPYTQALLSAVPGGVPGQTRQRILLEGDPPSPLEPSSAQRFTARFPRHAAAFAPGDIGLRQAAPGHWVRCARLEVLEELAETTALAGTGGTN
jgi:oligopeptide/dipeptide ABC transporter ATP-binding protein